MHITENRRSIISVTPMEISEICFRYGISFSAPPNLPVCTLMIWAFPMTRRTTGPPIFCIPSLHQAKKVVKFQRIIKEKNKPALNRRYWNLNRALICIANAGLVRINPSVIARTMAQSSNRCCLQFSANKSLNYARANLQAKRHIAITLMHS